MSSCSAENDLPDKLGKQAEVVVVRLCFWPDHTECLLLRHQLDAHSITALIQGSAEYGETTE
jgi:hypothetical protein